MQDAENRLYAVPSGGMPMKMKNRQEEDPEDPMDTDVDMEWLGPSIKLRETHDQLGGYDGAFCYIYV